MKSSFTIHYNLWTGSARNTAPNVPLDLLSLEIPDPFKVYSSSTSITEPFWLVDNVTGENRILIFGRNHSLEIL